MAVRRLRLVVAVVGLVGLGATAGFASTTFTDVEEGRYYTDAVQWAADNGVTTGTSATTFSPESGDCAQNVTFASAMTKTWSSLRSTTSTTASMDWRRWMSCRVLQHKW